MPVLDVKPGWSGRDGSEAQGSAELVKTFTVRVDSALDDAVTVISNPLLPRINDAYSSTNFFIRCNRREAKPRNPYLWDVICKYATLSGRLDFPNPLDLPPQVHWGAVESTEPVENDADGQPLVYTTNQPFTLDNEIHDPILEVTRYYATIDVPLLMASIGGVNSDHFFAQPGQAKLVRGDATWIQEGDFTYWEVGWGVHFREGLPFDDLSGAGGPGKAWYRRVMNKGTRLWTGQRERIGNDPPGGPYTGPKRWKPILDDYGQPVSDFVPVSEDGKRELDFENGDSPHWLEKRMRQWIVFAFLNIL